ncbi:MAG: CvpA family protein [Anaplasma sp.]
MFLDAIMGLTVLFLALLGFLRGFIKEVFGIAGMVAAVVVTASYRGYFLDIYNARIHSEILSAILSGITVFVGVMTCVVLINSMVVKLLGPLRGNSLDKVAGSALGIAKGLTVAYCMFFVLETFLYAFAPRSPEDGMQVELPSWFVETYSYNFFSLVGEYVGDIIPEPMYGDIGVIVRELLDKGPGSSVEEEL